MLLACKKYKSGLADFAIRKGDFTLKDLDGRPRLKTTLLFWLKENLKSQLRRL